MNVPKGYKMTEVGVIPEDWEVKELADIGYFFSGGTPNTSKSEFYGGDIPWITSSDLNQGMILNVEGRITQKGLNNSSAKLIRKGTLLLALYGATAGVVGISLIDGAINQAVLAINSNTEDIQFLYQKFILAKDWIIKTYTQGGQPNLSGEIVKSIKFTFPPMPEQKAIARVLSDTDELINALDKLIAKKRDIKKAVMQELLTGKTRLPGFSGEWEVKRLGDHLEFLRNGVNSRSELTIDDPVKYLHYGDIHGSNSVFLNPLKLPSLPSSKASSLSRLKNGDLVFADASEDLDGVGKSVEITGASGIELVAGLHTIAVRFDNSVLADGFKAYLQFHPTFINQLRRLASGTKVYATNRSYIAGIEINLPSIEEQRSIAQVLSDMDKEITALEQRRDKTKALKQGMMQALLTGRIRLPKEDTNDA
ncbi:restriction endonuclease subunit S [Gloeomargaritales cyanobacterium VI4D9]|nr:restriction endonuclease subunit S [Gloeomargaritales cyanobacterium VI4D9]